MSINFKLVFIVSVSISVSLSADSTAVDSANLAELDGNTTTDNECRCFNTDLEIFGFKSEIRRGKLILSWNASEEVDDDCKIKYDISSSELAEIYFYRSMVANLQEINAERLQFCHSYNVKIRSYRNNIDCNVNDNALDYVIYSDPENITSLDVQIGNEKTNIEWSPTKYCTNYRLHVNGTVYNLNSSRAEFPQSLYCARISVQTVANDNKTSPLVTKSVPGEVLNLQMNVDGNDLVISWDPPKLDTCVTAYEIVVNGEINETNETSIKIIDFEGCTYYNVSVSAVSVEEKGKPSILQEIINPKAMKSVTSLKFNAAAKELYWEKPRKQEQCDIWFKINLTNLDYEGSFETNNTKIILENLGKCREYTATVISTMENALDSRSISANIITEKAVPNPPICKVEEVGQTTATISCSAEDILSNACTLQLIEIICDQETKSKKPKIFANETISDNENRTALIVDIVDLSAYTKYACTAKLYNTEGPSENSEKFTFQTTASAPSKPENFGVISVEATSCKVQWDPPKVIPGNLESYELTITPIQPKHFIPHSCTPDTPENFTVLLKTNSYFYSNALPNYEYEFSVRAKTTEFGDAAVINVETKFDVPEEPRDFNLYIENNLGIHYNVSVEFNWLYPCQTNGNVSYFLLKLYKTAFDDNETIDENPREFKIFPNELIHNLDYATVIEGIEAMYSYNATVQTVLENNLLSSETTKDFEAPPGLPSAPILTEITQSGKNTVLVNWEEPINKTGRLTNYNINVTFVRPLHIVPEDCTTYIGSEKIYLDSQKIFYEFISRPNYEYQITLAASTVAGFGQIDFQLFNSSKSTPETVRNLQFTLLENKETPEYDVKLNLTFDTPCNLNGELKEYEVTLNGERNGIIQTDVEKGIKLQYSFKLNAETNYSLTVTSITDYAEKGIASKQYFATNAGVPLVFPSVKPSVTSNQTSASFFLRKDFFGEDNGNILYYAVFLVKVEAYNNDTDKFGYWDGTIWPDGGNWTDDGIVKKRQTTPDRWNPFDKDSNDTSIEFILGNGIVNNCSEEFCNAPLSINATYALEIRAYTKRGYRNTNVLFFTTIPDMEKALTVIEILGIVVGVLAVIILSSGTGFYFWRKKMQPPPMIPQQVEQDLHLPIPISISNFPEYYAEIKAKPEILKMDFQAMHDTSLEEALPITIASLPENRKKNRYTNILPFDDTRVILNSPTSDYINASYIRGFTDRVEYIATQGPLAHTAHDFWKMIIDEDVNVIVMLAQFVEQKREKCYKYFPDKNEQIEIEDIQIRCSIELDYDYFRERHFFIQTNGKKYNIVHLQFMNWPDFGCPEGTENMLSFCLIMRKFIDEFSCKAVLHCSAGVGRTGTLISIDILLQIIRCEGNIDVHNVVLNLRKQRKNMVQTEAQYLYIHTCINDAILNPIVLEIKADEEHIYENAKGMELKIFKSDDNENIEMK